MRVVNENHLTHKSSPIARFDAWLDSGGRWPEFVGTALLATGFAVILAVFKILEG